jgi:short-subunit dehydrogenase
MFVITGASKGLGQEAAKLLLAKHKTVVCLSRTKPKLAGIEWVEVDLQNDESVEVAAKELLARKDKLEALINCAGVFGEYDAAALDAKEIKRLFYINVMGPMLLTSRLLARIKQDQADVVNVISTTGTKATKEMVYGGSKWGARGFSLSLQAELQDTACRVITFSPGGMETGFFDDFRSITDPENWMKPADVAQLMLSFLELPKIMEVSEVIINRKVSK